MWKDRQLTHVFVVPGDLPPSGGAQYGLAPACNTLAGGSPGQTASVRPAFQLEGAGRPCQRRFLPYPGTFRQAGGSYGLAPPLAARSRGAVRVRRQAFVPRFSWKERGEAVPGTVFVVPGDLPPSGGARTASPPRLQYARGGQSGSDGKCLSRVPAGRSGKGRASNGFCRTRGPSAKRGARTASPPRLHMLAGGRSGSDGKCSSRVSAGRSGKAVPVTVFVVPGDLPPSGGARQASPPRLHMLAGGSPGQTASVCPRVSAGRSGKAVPVTVFVVPGDLPPSGGARTASPPRLHMLAGGQSGSDGKRLSPRFSWKEREGPCR
jgi:hypothetical protein